MVSWVLEWGPHARAIEPPELVASIIAELDAARRGYEGSGASPVSAPVSEPVSGKDA